MANRLALELVADANGLLKTLEQTQRQLNGFIKSSEAAGQALGGGVNRALDNFLGLAQGGAVAAGILAGGFLAAAGGAAALVQSAGRQAEMLEQTSQKTGIAVGTLQNWTVAMAQSGVGMDGLTRGVKQLSVQIVQSRTPNSQAAEKFSELGITANSVDDVLEQLADRFDMMPDGADKTRIAVELFGKAGQDLIPILNKGSAGLRESMNASKALGVVLSDDTVKSLAAADDAFDTLSVATKAAANQLAGLMAPAVTTVTESFSRGIGVVATFFGALNEGSKGGDNTIQFLKTINPFIRGLGGPGFNVEAMEKQAKDMTAFGEESKRLHDELIAKLEAEGRIQEDMGQRILADSLRRWREITAEMKAQEQLGRNVNALAEADRKERNADFARRLQQEEDINNLQFGPATVSEGMKSREAAVENLIRLMPELTHQEAALLALHNQQSGHDTIVATTEAFRNQNKEIERGILNLLQLYPELSRAQAEAQAIDQAQKGHQIMRETTEAWKDRNRELELGVEYAKADFQLQQAWYSQAPGLIGQADLARQKCFELLQAENDLRRQVIDETIFDEERKGAAIYALDLELQSKRIGIINQFPTFWERQLSSMVSSNAFSIASMTSSFNQATALWVQGKGTFDQFLEQSQTTLIQSGLQAAEQWLAELALSQLREMGMIATQEATKTAAETTASAARIGRASAEATAILSVYTAMETAKTAATTAAEAARLGITIGTNKAIMAGVISTLGGIAAVGNAALATMQIVVTTVSGIMAGIGAALIAGVFTAPIGAVMVGAAATLLATGTAAVATGIGVLQGALGTAIGSATALLATPFASGGIATGPTLGFMAEAGVPEAAIPLNDRGARFMQSMMGLGGSGAQEINLYVDGRLMTKQIVKHMPDVIHTKLGYT